MNDAHRTLSADQIRVFRRGYLWAANLLAFLIVAAHLGTLPWWAPVVLIVVVDLLAIGLFVGRNQTIQEWSKT